MIRRFLSVFVFTATITLASFGQDVFGRSDIIKWAHYIEQDGPKQAVIAWHKTDEALAKLSPEAGSATCTYSFSDLNWAQKTYIAS